MSSIGDSILSEQSNALQQILSTVQEIEHKCTRLSAAIGSIQGQMNDLKEARQAPGIAEQYLFPINQGDPTTGLERSNDECANDQETFAESHNRLHLSRPRSVQTTLPDEGPCSPVRGRSGATSISRIVLTTYPNQSGIDPISLNWGHKDPLSRGPVVVSRNQSTLRRRNGMPFPFRFM